MNSKPIPYDGNEPYVFVSYAHNDSKAVLPIIESLISYGFRVWYDDGIKAGSEWAKVIAEKVDKCTVMIAMISDNYLKSDNCQDEIFLARENKTKIVIAYLESIQLPPDMKLRYGRFQAVRLADYDNTDSFVQQLSSAECMEECQNKFIERTNAPTPIRRTAKHTADVHQPTEERHYRSSNPSPAKSDDIAAVTAVFDELFGDDHENLKNDFLKDIF